MTAGSLAFARLLASACGGLEVPAVLAVIIQPSDYRAAATSFTLIACGLPAPLTSKLECLGFEGHWSRLAASYL
jgi:hypothetical protein